MNHKIIHDMSRIKREIWKREQVEYVEAKTKLKHAQFNSHIKLLVLCNFKSWFANSFLVGESSYV